MPKPRHDTGPRPPGKQPDRRTLHETALRHLARFAATEAGLLRVLDRRILRWQHAANETDDTAAPSRAAAREVVRALVAAGALDDATYAAARASRLVRAGRSRRAVSAHLAAKGVDAETASAALPDAESEFLAAIAFLRRRRLGPFRPPTDDPPPDASGDRLRELATIGRAGFPRDIAERALRLEPDVAAELLAALKRG